MHQHSGLTATGAREHELMTGRGSNGLTLRVVEGLQNVSDIHGPNSNPKACTEYVARSHLG